jgi:hypothetical protein
MRQRCAAVVSLVLSTQEVVAMSVLDELKGLEDKIRSRMRELQPFVQEYAELERVAQRLGVNTDDSATAAAPSAAPAAAARKPSARNGTRSKKQAKRSVRTAARSAARAPSTRTRRPATKSVDRSAQILAIVAERPGITVREVGSELGVDPTSLYRVIRQLESSGAINKDGRQLQPV